VRSDERPTAPNPSDTGAGARGPLNPALVAQGRTIFRFDDWKEKQHGHPMEEIGTRIHRACVALNILERMSAG
jgi:hypothetical protein